MEQSHLICLTMENVVGFVLGGGMQSKPNTPPTQFPSQAQLLFKKLQCQLQMAQNSDLKMQQLITHILSIFTSSGDKNTNKGIKWHLLQSVSFWVFFLLQQAQVTMFFILLLKIIYWGRNSGAKC